MLVLKNLLVFDHSFIAEKFSNSSLADSEAKRAGFGVDLNKGRVSPARISAAGAGALKLLCQRRRRPPHEALTPLELSPGSTGALEPVSPERGVERRPGFVPTARPQLDAGFSARQALRQA